MDTSSSSTFTFANCKVLFNMKWNLYKINWDYVVERFNKMEELFGAVILLCFWCFEVNNCRGATQSRPFLLQWKAATSFTDSLLLAGNIRYNPLREQKKPSHVVNKRLIVNSVLRASLAIYQGAQANTTSTEASTSSENVTSRFCEYFSMIQSHHAWKMCSNYPGIKLEPALGT